MGQVLNKFGNEEKKEKEIEGIIDELYDKYFVDIKGWTSANFYHAICQTVEEINKTIGSTQFRVPKTSTLEQVYHKHHHGKGKALTREEFEKILQAVIFESGIRSVGAKGLVFYMYGVPATALLLKNKFVPNLMPNFVFIPALTSATVFLLAILNKI